MSQATLKPFLWACRATFILCNKKALAYYYRSSAWRDRSPERVVTIHKSPAQLYFLFGIFIIPRRCKYANEAGGPPEAKGVTWETKPRPVGCHLFNLSSDMALEKLVTWRRHNGVKSFEFLCTFYTYTYALLFLRQSKRPKTLKMIILYKVFHLVFWASDLFNCGNII